MANVVHAIPVELLQEIFSLVELPHLFNAMAVCRSWLLVGRSEVRKRLETLELKSPLPSEIQRHTLDSERAAQTLKWRQHGSKTLSWFQVGRHEANLAFGDLPSGNSSGLVFASDDGRVLLRSFASEGGVVNQLFSTDDVTSFLRFWGGKNETYHEFTSANREYLGDYLVAEDLRPSFLITLPETHQVIDASFHHHAMAHTAVCGFKNPNELATSLFNGSLSSKFVHRIDLALLSVKRQVAVSSVVLEASRHVKFPWPKRPSIGPQWRIIGLVMFDDICKEHSEPTAVQHDTKLDAVMVACHEGIEIIYLPTRNGRPRKDIHAAYLPRRWVKLPDDHSLGYVLAMASTQNGSVLVTRSPQPRDIDSTDSMRRPLNPIWWILELLSRSQNPGMPCFVRMPWALDLINPITHTEREFVFWNTVEKRTQISYVSNHHATHPIIMLPIAELRQPPFATPEQSPTALAACYRPYLYIVAASYLATTPQNRKQTGDTAPTAMNTADTSITTPETPTMTQETLKFIAETGISTAQPALSTTGAPLTTPVLVRDTPETPIVTPEPATHPAHTPLSSNEITEDIYLALYTPPVTTTYGHPISIGSSPGCTPHYIGSVTSPLGLAFLRLDIRIAGNLKDRNITSPPAQAASASFAGCGPSGFHPANSTTGSHPSTQTRSPHPPTPPAPRYTIPSHRSRPDAGSANGERLYHQDLASFEATEDSDDLVVLVMGFKGGSGVKVWYLAKSIEAKVWGPRREEWVWMGEGEGKGLVKVGVTSRQERERGMGKGKEKKLGMRERIKKMFTKEKGDASGSGP